MFETLLPKTLFNKCRNLWRVMAVILKSTHIHVYAHAFANPSCTFYIHRHEDVGFSFLVNTPVLLEVWCRKRLRLRLGVRRSKHLSATEGRVHRPNLTQRHQFQQQLSLRRFWVCWFWDSHRIYDQIHVNQHWLVSLYYLTCW